MKPLALNSEWRGERGNTLYDGTVWAFHHTLP